MVLTLKHDAIYDKIAAVTTYRRDLGSSVWPVELSLMGWYRRIWPESRQFLLMSEVGET